MFTWIYQLRLCYKGLYSVVSEIRNNVGVSHNALFRNSLTHSVLASIEDVEQVYLTIPDLGLYDLCGW